jgi:hypothetical protein
MRLLPLALLAALVGCDGDIIPADTSSSGSTSTTGTGGPCSTDDGYRVCGGPNDCDAQCGCVVVATEHDDLGVCAPDIADYAGFLNGCPDGLLQIYPALCIPWSLGMLFCENGAADAIRYVDNGAFDCEPLPNASECPMTTGIQLCGDACGPCAADELCTGRSKLHPFSMCIPASNDSCGVQYPDCGPGNLCMLYLVDESDQPDADRLGHCVPEALCNAAALELPGGAKCLPPP